MICMSLRSIKLFT